MCVRAKMVAATPHRNPVTDRCTGGPRGHPIVSFYLLVILIYMSRIKVLETILILVLACVVIYWWFGKNPYSLLAAGIIGLLGLFIPFLAEKIHWAWMKLAEGLGYVMGKLILTIVFLVFLVPVSAISKLFRKRTVDIRQREGASYFKDRNFTYNKESLENVW